MTEEGTVFEFKIYGEFTDELHGVLPRSAQLLILQVVKLNRSLWRI